jgi:flagellar hook protein FlgE
MLPFMPAPPQVLRSWVKQVLLVMERSKSGATENANVDLTQELVDLITEQRNFQANAKAIETDTTLTQTIIQIRA